MAIEIDMRPCCRLHVGMIIALLLPLVMPIVGAICLFAAYRPNRLSHVLLQLTGWSLLALAAWYLAVFVFGVL